MAVIRLATEADAEAIAAIYAPVVRDTAISFELVPPDGTEMASRLGKVLPKLPWLVYEHEGVVLGYAYAAPFRERPAYRWTLEATVYVKDTARGQGVGRALYGALLPLLRAMGYQTLMAGITLPNAGSVGLHEAMGFVPAGVFEDVGYKFGAWHPVGFWRLALRDRPETPDEPLPLAAVWQAPIQV
jgi:phosphinothricin acetyltransferase